MSSIDDRLADQAEQVRCRLLSLVHPTVRQVYCDETLLVLDKPAGILSHPNPPARQAANALLRCEYDFEAEAFCAASHEGGVAQSPPQRLYLIHRLDQDTSGLILCAFEEAAAATLKQALARREMHKEYLALVLGIPRAAEGAWRDCLQKRARRGRAEVAVVKGRPNAVTRFRRLKVYEGVGAALLQLLPETGRTHQLRVQAASRGLPIAGDDRYGDFAANRRAAQSLGLRRMFLHAQGLELRHPATGDVVRFTADLEQPLREALTKAARLRKPLRVAARR
jgi:23S rRNA pseudouridine955/2504/2580 synthase